MRSPDIDFNQEVNFGTPERPRMQTIGDVAQRVVDRIDPMILSRDPNPLGTAANEVSQLASTATVTLFIEELATRAIRDRAVISQTDAPGDQNPQVPSEAVVYQTPAKDNL